MGAAKTVLHGKSIRPLIILHIFPTDSYGLRKAAAAAVGLPHIGRGAALLRISPQVFERFLAPGNPGREWGRMFVLHIHDAGK